jgi:hypothetical protein
MVRYFFLAAFFAAFFAGAFLAAFLVAICLFSLSMGCIDFLQTEIAVEKDIDLCNASVKKKTHWWWKKQQQFLHFFSDIVADTHSFRCGEEISAARASVQ